MKNHIAILGAGESGLGAALLATKNKENVFVSDGGTIKEKFKKELEINKIPFEEKGHNFEMLKDAKLVIKSPGISSQLEIIKKLEEQGSNLISEIEYGYQLCNGKIIAITGSNGKTTTSGLIYHVLKRAGKDVVIGGNYGKSFCRLLHTGNNDIYVIELSSFQLDDITSFRPGTAVLLNISPDHLDRYNDDFEAYAKAKLRIIENQSLNDLFIYNSSDKMISKHLKDKEILARKIAIGKIVDREGELSINSKKIFDLRKCSLKGRHNLMNISCAIHAVLEEGLNEEEIQSGLDTFKNAPHRLETVAIINGVEFINDSKATNVEAAWFALDAMKGAVIWIAGGMDKGNDYSSLQTIAKDKVKALICLGKDNTKLIKAFTNVIDDIEETEDMEELIRKINSKTKKGDVVLLSPACASFDLFKNYEDRGDRFKEAIWNELRNK